MKQEEGKRPSGVQLALHRLWAQEGTLYSDAAVRWLQTATQEALIAECGVLPEDPDEVRLREHIRRHGSLTINDADVWQPANEYIRARAGSLEGLSEERLRYLGKGWYRLHSNRGREYHEAVAELKLWIEESAADDARALAEENERKANAARKQWWDDYEKRNAELHKDIARFARAHPSPLVVAESDEFRYYRHKAREYEWLAERERAFQLCALREYERRCNNAIEDAIYSLGYEYRARMLEELAPPPPPPPGIVVFASDDWQRVFYG